MNYRRLFPLAVICAAAFAQTDPSGHWEGTLEVPDGSKVLSLDIARNPQGAWAASLGVPEQKATGLRVTGIRLEGSQLTFNSPDIPGGATFSLKVADGKLTGSLLVKGTSLPLEMKRTGDAKVEVALPSPAVSRELEGDWAGEVTLPNGQTRDVAVHFRNQADKTVTGTIDSPSQGAQSLELSGIRQTGTEVVFELALKAAGGSYKGTLNKAGTELTGAWTQRASAEPIPLTLKKK